MIKDLRKEEKSLGDKIIIPNKGHLTIRYKIEYHDKHFQRVIAYVGPCNDHKWRAAYHTNSVAKIRILKSSRSDTPKQTIKKLMKAVKTQNQLMAQWI